MPSKLVKNYEELRVSILREESVKTKFSLACTVLWARPTAGPILVPGSRSRDFSNTGRTVDDPDAIFRRLHYESIDLDFSVSGKDVFELSATLVVGNPEDPSEYIYIGKLADLE